MTYEIAFVLFVLCIMIFCLVKELARPDIIVFSALSAFLFTGILTPEEALKGFSNEGVLTIALLFIVAGAVQQSGVLHHFISYSLGSPNSRFVLLRLMLPVSTMSAFMNNTPIVVMLMSEIRSWCKKYKKSPSKLLLPLSYASIFGGLITLIGTSTNLVIHGLLLENGYTGYSMFQLAVVGIPAAILGTIYMSTLGYKWLPSRKTLEDELEEQSKEYLTELIVQANCPLIGKSIEEAGLRNLSGLYLIEIIRGKERITPVSSYEKIKEEDHLIFTGVVSTIVELQNIEGLLFQDRHEISLHDLKNGESQLIEAVVSHHSSLLNKTIKSNHFRSKYDAAVVAVHRNNERIQSKIGEITLKPGDTLLLLVGKEFSKRYQPNDFYVTSPIETSQFVDKKKSKWSIMALISMVLLASFGILSMLKAAIIAVLILLVGKTITPEEAKKHVHFNILLLIASAIGIGGVISKTGTADLIASNIIKASDGLNMIGIIIIIYLLTNILTEIITNSAAAVLMFPIGLSTAAHIGADPMLFIIPITIAASASFMTPIGYQTNLLVYGPGGYKFSDYMKLGAPVSLIYMLVTVVTVLFVWG